MLAASTVVSTALAVGGIVLLDSEEAVLIYADSGCQGRLSEGGILVLGGHVLRCTRTVTD